MHLSDDYKSILWGLTQYGLSSGKDFEKYAIRLRTELGDSIRTYQHSKTTPIHVNGQGSCASPAIWLLISSIVMECLSKLRGGMTMIDVQDNNSLQQWIDGLVDDTSIFTNNIQINHYSDLTDLAEQLTKDIINWKELLEASGVKLELSKCFTIYCHANLMKKKMHFLCRFRTNKSKE
jgi:hypothetical protein